MFDQDKLLVAAAIAAGAVFLASNANARPPASVEARVQAAAEKGPEQLRAFIHRTRNIWDLNYADYEAYLPSQPEARADITLGLEGDSGNGNGGGNGRSEPSPDEGVAGLSAPTAASREQDEFRDQLYRDLLRE